MFRSNFFKTVKSLVDKAIVDAEAKYKAIEENIEAKHFSAIKDLERQRDTAKTAAALSTAKEALTNLLNP